MNTNSISTFHKMVTKNFVLIRDNLWYSYQLLWWWLVMRRDASEALQPSPVTTLVFLRLSKDINGYEILTGMIRLTSTGLITVHPVTRLGLIP